VVVLAVAGVLSGGDDEEEPAPAGGTIEAPATDQPPEDEAATGARKPKPTEVEVGGRPTAVAADETTVWVADSFSPRGALVESATEAPTRFDLNGPASDVIVPDTGAYYALPEQQIVERLNTDDPGKAGDVIELEGFPSVLAASDGGVYALTDKSVEMIDVDRGEVIERFELDGFGSGLAVGAGFLWVVVDNREVTRLDPDSGEAEGDPVEVPEAFGLTVDDDGVWVVSASGEITRIDPSSLESTTAPTPVRGALDVAVGLGSVWVTSSRKTLTRLDPETLQAVGDPVRVGSEPASITVSGDAVWVANGGDGTLTRVEP
jgi:hypothetical protein